ncbi:hypothetical protein D3C84_1215300 [compost metagenome]
MASISGVDIEPFVVQVPFDLFTSHPTEASGSVLIALVVTEEAHSGCADVLVLTGTHPFANR